MGYSGSGIEGERDGMTFWIIATFADGSPEPVVRNSPRLVPFENTPAVAVDAEMEAAQSLALQGKIEILKRSKLSVEDMAHVLEKDPRVIDPNWKPADGKGHVPHKVDFNFPVEFTTEATSKAKLTFELRGANSEGKELSYGSFTTPIAEVHARHDNTIVEEKKLDNGALVKYKVQVLYEDHGRVISARPNNNRVSSK